VLRPLVKTFTITPALAPLLEQMSHDMAVPVEGLVNQALFNWARLHGYAEPSVTPVTKPPAAPPPEPETTRVPIIEEPEPDWRIEGAGSFGIADSTEPRGEKLRRVVLQLQGREVELDSQRFLIGRDVSCDLTIDAPRISRQHAVIHIGEHVELEDLGSSNGTWHLGARIERRRLEHGDELYLGDVAVRVEFR